MWRTICGRTGNLDGSGDREFSSTARSPLHEKDSSPTTIRRTLTTALAAGAALAVAEAAQDTLGGEIISISEDGVEAV